MHILFIFKDIEEENLGVMYLSSVLKKHNHTVDIVEPNIEKVKSKLPSNKLTVVAYSTLAYYANFYLNFNKYLKNYFNIFSIFGGPYPTAQPEIINTQGVDAVCIGEGEHPFLELVNALENKLNICNIKNLWLKNNGHLFKNPLRPLIDDLDSLIFPDRNLFQKKAPFFYDRISMITSRGCTYSCPYCYNSTLRHIYKEHNNIYRRRSVNNVISEIKTILSHQRVNFILFLDDIFTIQPTWIEDFTIKYKKEIKIPFSCNIRIDTIDATTTKLLRHAGCYSVSFGIESGSDIVRKNVLMRNMSKNAMITAAKLLKQNNIRIRTTNIIGIPGQSLDADIETIKLNIQCGVDLAKVGVLSAYPNTDIGIQHTNAKEGWSIYTYNKPPLLLRLFKGSSINIFCTFMRKLILFDNNSLDERNEHERRLLRNLHKLFPVIVGFPFLLPLTKTLIKLHMSSFFSYVHFIWDNYCSYFRIYHTGFKSFLKGFAMYFSTKKCVHNKMES